MADRHKSKPKAVRMPDGLLAWYGQHAEATGSTLNGAIVAALEDYRKRHEGTPLEATGPGRDEVPVVKSGRRPRVAVAVPDCSEEETAQKPGNCKHPKVRVKGVCPDCQEWAVKS
jgi:hypothetical protein